MTTQKDRLLPFPDGSELCPGDRTLMAHYRICAKCQKGGGTQRRCIVRQRIATGRPASTWREVERRWK